MSTDENVIRISASPAPVSSDVRPSGELRSSDTSAQTESSGSDAVKVSFSADTAARISKENVQEITKAVEAEAKSTQERAAEAAKSFEDLINAISPTTVRFGVGVASKGEAINFQVVDKKSGKVVREFPPESFHRNP